MNCVGLVKAVQESGIGRTGNQMEWNDLRRAYAYNVLDGSQNAGVYSIYVDKLGSLKIYGIMAIIQFDMNNKKHYGIIVSFDL